MKDDSMARRVNLPMLLAALLAGTSAVAADEVPETNQLAVLGRAPESASVESTLGHNTLPDAVDVVPEVNFLDNTELETRELLSTANWSAVAVFEGPCHFSDRTNDPSHTLLIYEGMQVAVNPDGRYLVSFIAESPRTPAVVRLQLRVRRLVGREQFDCGTVTLPPIVIKPASDLSDQQPSTTIRVRRSGSSHLLRRLQAESGTESLSLSRSGIARFGTIPEAANYTFSGRRADQPQ
jgi:hypothetical protein